MSETTNQIEPRTMAALTQSRYGAPEEVLSLQIVPVPDVGDEDVLIEVEASSINPADWHGVRGEPLIARVVIGLRSPSANSPGCDVAGVAAQVGRAVDGVKVGDRVIGYPPEKRRGGFAASAVVPADSVAILPNDVQSAHGACLPLAGGTALHAVRDHAQISSGQRVLIVGASGGVGSIAVQLAKHFGAHVTGVCSGRNVEFVRQLGADVVIDYTATNYASVPEGGAGYDSILQIGGTMPASQLRQALTTEGRLVVMGGDGGGRWLGAVGRIMRGVFSSPFGRGRIVTMNAVPTKADLETLLSLVSEGALRIYIDKTVPLSEVPDAIRQIETAHTRGKISVAI